MKQFAAALFVQVLAGLTGFAQFEGTLEMKMTIAAKDAESRGSGTAKIAVAKAGARSEVTLKVTQMEMKMSTLFRNDTPDILYRINDGKRTYSEVNLAKVRDTATRASDTEKYTVEKLGEEKMLGYRTQHVLVTHGSESTEMWVAKDFLDYETYSRLQARAGGRMGADGMQKALKEAGADGMPLKSIITSNDGGKVTTEVVKAEKMTLPASTFEIPAGYTKTAEEAMDTLGGVSNPQLDAARKQMEEAMKNMTPEQRAMLEKMMKQRSPGNQ